MPIYYSVFVGDASFAMLRRVLPVRRTPLVRRSMSSEAPKQSAGFAAWFQHNKATVSNVGLSFVCFMTALKLYNVRREAEEDEAELRHQLRDATLARTALLQQLPGIAREAGLPAKAMGKFETILQATLKEIDSSPEQAVQQGLARAREAAAASSPSPSASSNSSKAQAPKSQAVW